MKALNPFNTSGCSQKCAGAIVLFFNNRAACFLSVVLFLQIEAGPTNDEPANNKVNAADCPRWVIRAAADWRR
jgi:hypothetical protein